MSLIWQWRSSPIDKNIRSWIRLTSIRLYDDITCSHINLWLTNRLTYYNINIIILYYFDSIARNKLNVYRILRFKFRTNSVKNKATKFVLYFILFFLLKLLWIRYFYYFHVSIELKIDDHRTTGDVPDFLVQTLWTGAKILRDAITIYGIILIIFSYVVKYYDCNNNPN